MKRFTILLAALFMMSATVPVFAANMTKEQKDQCLLASKDCKNATDSIQQKIKKLQVEINKGTKVYDANELKKLNDKLKEAEDLLDGLMKN